VTDEPLDADDLVAVSSSAAVKPRPTAATSIPGLLSLFQNEWDATMLEAHQLRQALHASRQELSHALYQHDAATRVIARLIRERDAFRAQLEAAAAAAPPPPALEGANGKRGAAAPAAPEGAEAPAGKKAKPALPPAVAEAMSARSAELSKGRKKRVVPASTATPEDLAAYSLQSSVPLHATRKGGIAAVALAPGAPSLSATAGADASVQLYDRAAGRAVAALKGHSKKVNDVAFVGSRSLLASASADGTVRVWRAGAGDAGDDYECAHVLQDQSGDVVSVCVHPTGDYLFSAASDATWALYDVARGACLARVPADGPGAAGYASAALHPDGLILATGASDAGLAVWEARTQKRVASFDGHTGAVTSLSFSENGYHLASAAADGVKLWDLRKLKNFQSLEPYGEGKAAAAVAFDPSGLYLAVGGADARVYGVKQEWRVLAEFGDVPKKGVSALAWAPDARELLVGAADHNLRVFGAARE
jgi:pre-mRNA-processing factor 19